MSDAFLVCELVGKAFGETKAVDAVDLEVDRGELLSLLGPSGCGKTTLLRLIAGFEAPDQGVIRLGDRILSSPRHRVPPEKRRVALVFQDFALFPHLDTAGNVSFGLPKGSEKRTRVRQLLELVGLAGLEGRMPHQLSGGQQQRVALARALASEPDLILFDEPFSNLDPSIRTRVRAEVKQLLESIGVTAIFVTHDQEEALSIAEQVGVMMHGKILQIGPPHEVYTKPVDRHVGEFVGGANILLGRAGEGYVECELGRLPLDAGFAGDADLMIRAEDLSMDSEAGKEATVLAIEYYGHDQMLTLALPSGTQVKVRTLATHTVSEGETVRVSLKGEVLAFPST